MLCTILYICICWANDEFQVSTEDLSLTQEKYTNWNIKAVCISSIYFIDSRCCKFKFIYAFNRAVGKTNLLPFDGVEFPF